MKSPEMVLRNALVTTASFTTKAGQKVYPLAVPANITLPWVTWRRAGIQRAQVMGGPMGMPRVTVEYSILAGTYEDARELADTMRSILDGYGGTLDNTTVDQVSLENEADDFVSLSGNEIPTAYQITQTYDVWWQET